MDEIKPGPITLALGVEPSVADFAAIQRILNENNKAFGFEWSAAPISILLKDESGAVFGGLTGSTNWGWLHVDLLAVDSRLRGEGFGSRLLGEAEERARERGCGFAYLDTFSFQARAFYEKRGYEVYGVLDDFPTGASRIFLKKTL